MVEKRTAKRAHEKVIGQGVILGPLPQLELAAVVVAHGPAAHIGHGGKAVVLAAVDLLLVVIKIVHRVGHDLGRGAIDGRRINAKRRVGQARKTRIGLAIGTKGNERLERLAVMVQLGLLRGRGTADAIGAGKQAVHIVKAVVFGVEDDHVADALQRRGVRAGYSVAGAPTQRGTSGNDPGKRDRERRHGSVQTLKTAV